MTTRTHVVVDCGTRQQVALPLTAEEETQFQADAAAVAAAEQAATDAQTDLEAKKKAWRDSVKNASSLAALKDAILGTSTAVEPEVRPR